MEFKDYKPYYLTKRCSDMSERQLKQCSVLYSENYGMWSGKDGKHTMGNPIKMGVAQYEKLRTNDEMYVSLCYNKQTLLGHAFFLKTVLDDGKTCIWVTQLVVRKDVREMGIATKLLQSAWGFSDYFAWGLATTNAVTIKTLESVTWRQVSPQFIKKNIDVIKKLSNKVSFTKDAEVIVVDNVSQINSQFFPNFQDLKNGVNEIYVQRLGKIKDGYEWLAFTFQSQEMIFSQEHFDKMLDFSTSQLMDAYGRMRVSNQSWAKSTSHEIDTIIDRLNLKGDESILDMGCGTGRHSIELCQRGYSVTAVDFSTRLIQKARKAAKRVHMASKIAFYEEDCRHLRLRRTFDCIICLYDVIGSFRDYKQNRLIVENAYSILIKGGKAVFSVMNMELTSSIAKYKCIVKENPRALLKLKASSIMQTSGNIFNPDYFLLDDSTHLVYRKEQFSSDGLLSAEYLIADFRFTLSEITSLLKDVGFKNIQASYVGLNQWNVPLSSTDPRAKEILIFAEK